MFACCTRLNSADKCEKACNRAEFFLGGGEREFELIPTRGEVSCCLGVQMLVVGNGLPVALDETCTV